jgi:hypothetical protein
VLPNVDPYIYDVKISGKTRSSIYIYHISRPRVKDSVFKALKRYKYSSSVIKTKLLMLCKEIIAA